MTNNLVLQPFQMVLLITGPAGSGKTSLAETISTVEGWYKISEDEVWDEIGHPPHQLRHDWEQTKVHELVHSKIIEQLRQFKSVVVEFILFHNPPQTLFDYQNFLANNKIPFATKVLRPSLETLVQRAIQRGRKTDLKYSKRFKTNAQHQLNCLLSVNTNWIVDNSDETLEEIFNKHFRAIVQKGQPNAIF